MKKLLLGMVLVAALGAAQANAAVCGTFVKCGKYAGPVQVNGGLAWNERLTITEGTDNAVDLLFAVTYTDGTEQHINVFFAFQSDGSFEIRSPMMQGPIGIGKCADFRCTYTRQGSTQQLLSGSVTFEADGTLVREERSEDGAYVLSTTMQPMSGR